MNNPTIVIESNGRMVAMHQGRRVILEGSRVSDTAIMQADAKKQRHDQEISKLRRIIRQAEEGMGKESEQ